MGAFGLPPGGNLAIQLFKAGAGHVKNGIECEVGTFDEYSYLHLLDQGWYYSPEECYAEENDKEEKDGPEEKTEQETYAEEKGVLIEDGIRATAKDVGIKRYWMKSIDTLEKELMELSDEHRTEG
jgi:hypothetical protein